MRLVLDTNILIAALIKDSVTRRILLLPDLEFSLPAFALDELARHRSEDRPGGSTQRGRIGFAADASTGVGDCCSL